MMLSAVTAPATVLVSVWHTRAKPPENHSHVCVYENFPAGPNEFGLVSPSEAHLPAKYASFCCSGPGLGGPEGACAKTVATNAKVNRTLAATAIFFFMLMQSSLDAFLVRDRR